MTSPLRDLLQARTTRAFDIDAEGNVLVGDDRTGSVQLYEISGDGEWSVLTDLGEGCSGRYLPGERTVVVQHDTGGNERGQLSLIRRDGGNAAGSTPALEPLVHDPRFVHRILDVLPGRLLYATNRRDGVEFDVVIRDIATGDERVLYDRGGLVEEVTVSPDEHYLVLVRPSSGANSSQLLLVEVASGRVEELTPETELAVNERPSWLSDGSGFVFTSNSGRDYTAIARYDLEPRTWEYLVENDDHDLTGWLSPDGTRLLVRRLDDGADQLAVVDPLTTEQLSTVDIPAVSSATSAHDPVWSADGRRIAVTVTSPTEPGDVYLADGPVTRRLTDSSATLDKQSLAAPESHRVPTPDGEQVPCFLYRPEEGDGSVVVVVHGGPEAAAVHTWNPIVQGLVQAGHAVVVPNVRGSAGYGKRWYSLDDVRLRLDSVADLAAVHAWLPTVGLDQRRAALYGRSYGGYMVLAGVTMQPDLWAAGVDIVGISSLVTFLENTSAYRRAAREREYGSLADDRDFLVQASPLTHIDAIRAPMLILHGANDPRVPVGEAEQVAAAVRSHGIPCELTGLRRRGAQPQQAAHRARYASAGGGVPHPSSREGLTDRIRGPAPGPTTATRRTASGRGRRSSARGSIGPTPPAPEGSPPARRTRRSAASPRPPRPAARGRRTIAPARRGRRGGRPAW